MTSTHRCPRCDRETPDGALCPICSRAYIKARKDLTRYAAELRTVWARLDNTTRIGAAPKVDIQPPPTRTTSPIAAMLRAKNNTMQLTSHPLPVNLDAGALHKQAIALLAACPPDERWLRCQPEAARIVNEMRRMAHVVERAIDNDEPDLFLGLCTAPDIRAELDPTDRVIVEVDAVCGARLYCHLGDISVTCRTCGISYPVTDRKTWVMKEILNVTARPALIAKALTTLDMPLNTGTLDTWISRDKRLHEQGRQRPDGQPLILEDPVRDDDGKPLYRVGDVIARVEAMRAREAS